jgi:hypothetical protein
MRRRETERRKRNKGEPRFAFVFMGLLQILAEGRYGNPGGRVVGAEGFEPPTYAL